MTAKSRIPDLGKVSIAIIEHSIEPILGEKAIAELRSPVYEKELRESLEMALKISERRFATELRDDKVCEAVLSLPLADLPTLQEALRKFYERPTDSTFAEVLRSRLSNDYTSLSKSQIDSAITSYIAILREELVPVSDEIRNKLNAYAMLGTERNTARIVEVLELHLKGSPLNLGEASVVKAPTLTKSGYKEPERTLIYEIGPQTGTNEIRNYWKFLSSSTGVVVISNGIIEIGSLDGETCSFPQIDPLENCSVEYDLKILDVGNNNDATLWAGVRLRGFLYDFRFGYLAYLRRVGTMELYRAQEVIGRAYEPRVPDTRNNWTNIRVDIFKSRMRVWVGGILHINVIDKKFRDKGLIFLHTYYTRAQFRNLRIFKLR